jgi:hypothetical protein
MERTSVGLDWGKISGGNGGNCNLGAMRENSATMDVVPSHGVIIFTDGHPSTPTLRGCEISINKRTEKP